jgi:hypothetical protein
LDISEDRDDGAGEHGAELHRISCVTPLTPQCGLPSL